MNKQTVGVPYGWKNNLDSHKTFSSLIFGEHPKTPPSQQNNHIFSPKNSREFSRKHTATIQRHASEDDLKEWKRKQHPPFHPKPENSVRPQNEYFTKPYHPTHPKNSIISIPSSTDSKQNPPVPSYQLEPPTIPKNSFLKETSSTQSAQNLKIAPHKSKYQPPPKPTSKVLKKLGFLCDGYGRMKMATPRNKLKRQNFKFISKLGQGKFGKVFMVKEVYTGIILAMKIVEKKKIIKQNLLEQFIRELKIQSFLNHPNIISLYGFFHDETHFYTLMELGCDGQLYGLMSSHPTRVLSEETTSFIIKNLLQAVDYMHERRILHRDIKPENIVLIMGNVKICDFGWAANKMHQTELRGTICGTPLYLSPELLNGQRYDEKVDIWAVGILAYELMVGSSPFDIADREDLHKIISEDVLFPKDSQLSEEFKTFILAMLCKDPHERMTSKRLLKEDFIKKYEEFETCEELCK